jgi:predicted DNA-binding helix-hairpin-helix protein
LARTYFSSFSPVPDTPLSDHAPSDPVREHRLYQASFLLRDYGSMWRSCRLSRTAICLGTPTPTGVGAPAFDLRPGRGEHRRPRDAAAHPGIGPKNADRIVSARRLGTLADLAIYATWDCDATRNALYLAKRQTTAAPTRSVGNVTLH